MKSLASIVTLSTCVALAASPALAGGCSASKSQASHASWSATSTPDIVDTAIAAGSFNTLVAAVKAADLVATLKSDGPFTVFAPTDEAFAKLPAGTLEGLLRDPDALRAILTYHVLPRDLGSDDIADRRRAKTVFGPRVTFTEGHQLMVNGAAIVQPDIRAANGVIHVIDSVILPPARLGQ